MELADLRKRLFELEAQELQLWEVLNTNYSPDTYEQILTIRERRMKLRLKAVEMGAEFY